MNFREVTAFSLSFFQDPGDPNGNSSIWPVAKLAYAEGSYTDRSSFTYGKDLLIHSLYSSFNILTTSTPGNFDVFIMRSLPENVVIDVLGGAGVLSSTAFYSDTPGQGRRSHSWRVEFEYPMLLPAGRAICTYLSYTQRSFVTGMTSIIASINDGT